MHPILLTPKEFYEVPALQQLCTQAEAALKSSDNDLLFYELLNEIHTLDVVGRLETLSVNPFLRPLWDRVLFLDDCARVKINQDLSLFGQLGEASKSTDNNQELQGILQKMTSLDIPKKLSYFNGVIDLQAQCNRKLQAVAVKVKLTQATTIPNPFLSRSSPFEIVAELKGFKKLEVLLADNNREDPREFVIPKRRICAFGGIESNHHKFMARKAIFITDEEILKIHPLQFLRQSPFIIGERYNQLKTLEDNDPMWEECDGCYGWVSDSVFVGLEKRMYAIGVTENGKHVILQQAVRSCVPTCVAMLVLDHGKTPNYDAIQDTDLANNEQAIRWIKEAGLTPHITKLPASRIIEALITCLEEQGPLILTIDHPAIGGHVIVLDEVSKEMNTASIRDPAHGWAITIKLDALLPWASSTVIQVKKP